MGRFDRVGCEYFGVGEPRKILLLLWLASSEETVHDLNLSAIID